MSSSQSLKSVYEAWSWLLDVRLLLPFSTQWITTMIAEYGNTGTLPFACVPACSPKSDAGHMFPRLPFFHPFRSTLAHFFQIISTHCGWIYLALWKFSNDTKDLKVSKQCATTVSQCSGPCSSWLKWFCSGIIDRCFHSSDPATHTFFHLINLLKLSCPILFANCFKKNSVYFKLIGSWPLAPPKFD